MKVLRDSHPLSLIFCSWSVDFAQFGDVCAVSFLCFDCGPKYVLLDGTAARKKNVPQL